MESQQTIKLKGTKRLFLKLGTCSRTLAHIVNREFGHLNNDHERALDPMAGGILQQGYQCGMLWGVSMAVGAEAYRRTDNLDNAIALSIKATQLVVESLIKRVDSIDCGDISECDWQSKKSIAKHMITGKVFFCFKLVEKWAPEAIEVAYEGLSFDQNLLPDHCISCASEVARKMGATDEEMVMMSGFAGGIGLSGDACGALGAAIWMKTLKELIRKNKKPGLSNPIWDKQLKDFYEATDYEMLCNKITGKQFETLDEHTEFIKNGGCEKLIYILAQSESSR